MKPFIVAIAIATLCAGLVAPTPADAKRLGGAKSSGIQRQAPDRAPPAATPTPPAQAAPTAPAGATAAAAAPAKRSWMGPLAGLAAGLGIAALMSHLGLGDALGNFMTMALMAIAAFVLIRFLMKRFGPKPANMVTPEGVQFAGNNLTTTSPSWSQATPAAVTAVKPLESHRAIALPEGFDSAEFERSAKLIFIRMQAANDRADLNDLRNFTTPEMFASIKLDLQERGTNTQITDVVKVDAEMLDLTSDAQQQLVSVRFHGLIREEAGSSATAFDEVWHLTQPLQTTPGTHQWAIAGIQQAA
jgi:predicted lipid-binding transport protein (Tim44 family)